MAIWRAALESWRSGFVNHSLNSHAADMAKTKISAAASGIYKIENQSYCNFL